VRAVDGRRRILRLRHPAQYLTAAFVGASLVGTLLLLLPFASRGEGSASFEEALFTATSAVCVTGLTVVDTAGHWTGFGQAVILLLIQVGGFGIMTLSSLIALFLARRLGLRHRVLAAAETGGVALTDVRRLVREVALFALAVEAVVAVLLGLLFWLGHDVALGRAAYLGLFHSVSAFNNAGFALWEDNLVRFVTDPAVLVVVATAVVVGGVGYPVWVEVARRPWRPRAWSLHSKLTVVGTLGLLTAGWVLLAWFEWTNPATLGPLAVSDSLTNALFHSAMPRTAGFNSVPIDGLRDSSRLVTEVLMFIGGGSASTAGGIKVSTFALLGWVMWAEARGDPEVVAFSRRVPETAQRQAVSVALLAIGAIVAGTILLLAIGGADRDALQFEVISALGTVGLSTGITAALPDASQLVLVGLMIMGRIGPITLFAALALRERERRLRHPEERPIVG
jgi:potassium uptake TrkH family protein